MNVGRWWRQRRARLLQLWVVGLVAACAVTGASAMGYLESLQARALDLLIYLQSPRRPSGLVIVAIDDAAFDALERRQPLPRDYLARVLRGVTRAGAAAVGFDISLRTAGATETDRALARAIVEFGERGERRLVVAGTSLPEHGPLAEPAVARLVVPSAPDVPVDADAVVRRASLRVGGVPAFAAAVANVPVPDAAAVYRINFIGPEGSFLTIPSDAVAAIGDLGVDIAGDNPLRGRIVLLGGTFADGRDVHRTPYGFMPGVEIQANIVHMLVTGSLVRPAGWLAGFAVQLIAVLLAGLVMVAMRPLWGTLVCLAGALLLGVPASYVAFSRGGYWVDFLLPVAVTSLLGVGADALAKRRLRDALGRYVSPEVAARVERNPAELAGERRQVSILFSDLRGFTTLSERMAPELMAARLTEYFDAMTGTIFARRGMVNDFIGDAILAVFGAPLDDPEHARHAIESALAMGQTLAGLNRRWQAQGLPPLRMGLGIHTGEVFAGNVGRAGKVKYAVVGDTVNLASRVEGLNKELGSTMLVTEATYRAAGLDLVVNDRGPIGVKGREEPVRVYEVIGLRPAAGPGGSKP
ncbi:MAG: adenylate/guanylate cyclase domain-containing protein [Candidatus Rokubacteria bacterium]|nr:adenylate/guanylate cyclase domain-containing protein [Candidatus Rokubacteria bacterium]